MNAKPLSSKRGNNRLKKSSDKLITRILKMLDQTWYISQREKTMEVVCPNCQKSHTVRIGPDLGSLDAALNKHIEVLPYIKPKLQAIAPAALDENGDISYYRIKALADQVEAELTQRKAPELPAPQSQGVTVVDDVIP